MLINFNKINSSFFKRIIWNYYEENELHWMNFQKCGSLWGGNGEIVHDFLSNILILLSFFNSWLQRFWIKPSDKTSCFISRYPWWTFFYSHFSLWNFGRFLSWQFRFSCVIRHESKERSKYSKLLKMSTPQKSKLTDNPI